MKRFPWVSFKTATSKGKRLSFTELIDVSLSIDQLQRLTTDLNKVTEFGHREYGNIKQGHAPSVVSAVTSSQRSRSSTVHYANNDTSKGKGQDGRSRSATHTRHVPPEVMERFPNFNIAKLPVVPPKDPKHASVTCRRCHRVGHIDKNCYAFKDKDNKWLNDLPKVRLARAPKGNQRHYGSPKTNQNSQNFPSTPRGNSKHTVSTVTVVPTGENYVNNDNTSLGSQPKN